MKNDIFLDKVVAIVGAKNVISQKKKTDFYSTGIRIGEGLVEFVLFPKNLWDLWRILEQCIAFNKIIIMQAANTGLTGGSTPDGDSYDRDVVIINCLSIDKLTLINNATQVIALPGTTLYQLEKALLPYYRGPHSIIGSSCIGASVIGGVCNNSGGNLVNRGPAYTELSLFARLNKAGKLELINHLGIDLGETPELILHNLQSSNYDPLSVPLTDRCASDSQYVTRLRDLDASSPARFNADPRRLYESSGCAGKIAVFAVRLDTFPLPQEEKLYFLGTNNPDNFTNLRENILRNSPELPDMAEYMHSSYFDASSRYCKDIFLFIKYFGTTFLRKFLYIKKSVDQFFCDTKIFPNNVTDLFLQFISNLFPSHIPQRICSYRKKYDHLMFFLTSDGSINSIKNILDKEKSISNDFEYIECTVKEAKDLLLHRYVAGSAPSRYKMLNSKDSGEILPLDVAFPRNCKEWHNIIPSDILSKMEVSFVMSHFFCMVFHLDFVVKKGVDAQSVKEEILKFFDEKNVKYPAEHNVGNLYKADKELASFYRNLDPTNTFNAGVGKMSKRKFYN